MLLAMACFAFEDALIKVSASSLPAGQVMMIFGAGGVLVFSASLAVKRVPIVKLAHFTRAMLVRAIFEGCGRVFFVLAVATGALSTATVVLQATPIVVVAAAWVFLGDRPTGGRWVALLVGAIGVVVVLGPSGDQLDWATVFAAIGMFGFAGRDLMSRTAPKALQVGHLGLWGFATLIVSGVAYQVWEGQHIVPVGVADSLVLLPAILCGVIAYAALMLAMRTGDISAVAPFRYFRLVFGVLMGVVFFGEDLQTQTMIGGALIVLSGLMLLISPAGVLRGVKRLRAI